MSKVTLVAITKPMIDGVNTAEEFIAYTAKVSNPASQINNETAPKLLKYLIKHKHWSPFEQVSLTMEIETTRDIGRQILRHRSFSFQEFSQRYADASQLGFETRECRLQDIKNRQNSIELGDSIKESLLDIEWGLKQNQILNKVEETYKWALDNGIAKEQARVVLPEGLTMSRMYMTGTLRSFLHYCQLRTGKETQKEHREVAKQCWSIIEKEFPSIIGALENE